MNARNGKLAVVRTEKTWNGKERWICRCDCGTERAFQPAAFRKQKSCGCSKDINLVGMVFGRLTVKSNAGRRDGCRYWNCLCLCGRQTVVKTAELRNRSVISCGCSKVDRLKAKHKAWGESCMLDVVCSYRHNAKVKGLECSLSVDEFSSLFAGNCYYCGRPPSNVKRRNNRHGPFVYNGVDRIDNAVGYVPGNVVSCCKKCNYKKSNDNQSEFLEWVRSIADLHPSTP